MVLWIGLISSGCESNEYEGNYEWNSHKDTLNILLTSNSIYFLFDFPFGNVDVVNPPSISHDSSLSAAARLELEVQLAVYKGSNIEGKATAHRWQNDTVLIGLDYDYNIIGPANTPPPPVAQRNKKPSQLPQTTPALPSIKLTSAKLFLPRQASATYIGR